MSIWDSNDFATKETVKSFSQQSEISHKIKGCSCTPSRMMRQTLKFTAGQSIVEIYLSVKGAARKTTGQWTSSHTHWWYLHLLDWGLIVAELNPRHAYKTQFQLVWTLKLPNNFKHQNRTTRTHGEGGKGKNYIVAQWLWLGV